MFDLVVIDGQNDFLDTDGNLCVKGAEQEANGLERFITRRVGEINKIHATLDKHHVNDIGHELFWEGVEPFTAITYEDVASGKITTKNPLHQERAMTYLLRLEKSGKPNHMVWPTHCLIGEWGSNVYTSLEEAYKFWVSKTGNFINYVEKGMNPFTEHYSAVKAEVTNPAYPETMPNEDFLNRLAKAEKIVWCGWAGSHCLKFTMEDAIDLGAEIAEKSVLLTDCCAPVPKFETWRDNFLADMDFHGVHLTDIKDF